METKKWIWSFFYDEGEGKAYESLTDWITEINHLRWPFLTLTIIVMFLLILIML